MWLQLTLTVSREQAPLIEALFENMGALSVTFGDAEDCPLLEPNPGETPLWHSTRVTALFDGERDMDELHGRLGQSLNPEIYRRIELEHIEDQAWERAWLDAFCPMPFGQRLWICPTGQCPETEGAVTVEMDPGLAFGTGTHPTTALCLNWLDSAELRGKTLIDYGCGSGILAVAALCLGADRVIAVDHDPQALEATGANAEKNSVIDRLEICDVGDPPQVPGEILLANILAGTLTDLSSRLAQLVKPGGTIVLSGILDEQAAGVVAAYRPHFEMRPPVEKEGWVLLEGIRSGS